MRRYRLAWLVAAVCLLGVAAPAPGDWPAVAVDGRMEVPAWAKRQRELLALHGRLAELIDRAYFTDEGEVRVRMEHGGGTRAPDDVMESLYKLPMHYALGADPITWRLYWRAWRGTTARGMERGLYVNRMPKYLDWHHNGEHFEGFWLGALCAPHDPAYRRLALKYASLYDGSDRPHQNYDPQRKLIPSVLHGGAGPQLEPTLRDWIDKELSDSRKEFWRAFLDCDHGSPLNLVTTNFGTIAFMLTGEARWRRRTMGYIDAWQRRARRNDGIIPSIVRRDGTVPGEWWGGVMGWDFERFGGLFMVSSGPRAAWANAALLTGETSYYQPMRRLCDVLWRHRRKVERDLGWGIEKGDWDVPRFYNGGRGWHGGLERAAGVYANMLANIWLATMDEADLRRVLDRANIRGAAGHAHWQEGGYEPEWVRYLTGDNPGWPKRALGQMVERTRKDIAALEKALQSEPERRGAAGWPRKWGWVGPLVNVMTGGPVPLWHGQLHMARFRYFDPERRRPGIPRHCAALVEKLSDTAATLTLVNTSEQRSHTVLVQAGAYAEHRCTTVTPEGGSTVNVDGPVFAVRLGPGAGRTLRVKMERFANTPTLTLPWRRDPPGQTDGPEP